MGQISVQKIALDNAWIGIKRKWFISDPEAKQKLRLAWVAFYSHQTRINKNETTFVS